MNTKKATIEIKWFIVPTTKHYGKLEIGQQVSSKYSIETFASESDWTDRLNELNISYESI